MRVFHKLITFVTYAFFQNLKGLYNFFVNWKKSWADSFSKKACSLFICWITLDFPKNISKSWRILSIYIIYNGRHHYEIFYRHDEIYQIFYRKKSSIKLDYHLKINCWIWNVLKRIYERSFYKFVSTFINIYKFLYFAQ